MQTPPYITNTKGPCVILAGAGTGKTRAIVDKVDYLIKNKLYAPKEILCLTFSNEAARSMEARIMEKGENPTVRTFHALCSDLLKKHGEKIGLSPDFRIIEPDDAMIMLHKNLKVPSRLCGEYIATIGTAKDLGITLEAFTQFVTEKRTRLPENLQNELEKAQFELRTLHSKKAARGDKIALQDKIDQYSVVVKQQKFLSIWRAYEKLKEKKKAQDYADLHINTLCLLEANPSIANQWKYCIVDEFQDTNKVQLDLLALLIEKNITIVGDMNQSIYRFRGAYKNNLEFFNKHFKANEKNVYTLAQSHRSPNRVLKAAHVLISNNYANKEDCFEVTSAYNTEGTPIEIYELNNAKEETRKIVEIIKHEAQSHKPEEICVIFRTHQQANLLKRTLEQQQIGYHATTKKPLMKHPIIRKVTSYLTILDALDNKRNGEASAWWELLQLMHVPPEDQAKIGEFMRNYKQSCLSESMLILPSLLALSAEGKSQYEILVKQINALVPHIKKKLPELLEEIYKLVHVPESEKTHEGRETLLVLQEFRSLIEQQYNHEFFDLSGLIYHFEIMRALDLELEAPAAEESGVRIMTAHSTKGLEYPVIIVANLAYKKFPLERVTSRGLIPSELIPEIQHELKNLPNDMKEDALKEYEREQQLKDERRLCYVAFTRTKEKLYITYAKEYANKETSPSQFLSELTYQKNPDIVFIKDTENKYEALEQTPSPKILAKKDKAPSFSPSSLKLFADCQKKYEYKYVFNMPEPTPTSWDAINLGSFVHQVIDQGIKEQFQNERTFLLYARELALKPEWENVDINDASLLLKVFFERNKGKYTSASKTEEKLFIKLEGIKFHGIADRIDFHPDGLEIIDYKTGYVPLTPRERNWQLGYYALASQPIGKVKRVTLDMLRHDRPLEFDINDKGIATERNTGRMSFSLDEIKQELVATAKQILQCYEKGFSACAPDKNCEFCNQYVWNVN
jgi:DNA helicase-2/ATP-dependent DNA helicase PcrA